jgi:hypothetical protein
LSARKHISISAEFMPSELLIGRSEKQCFEPHPRPTCR